MLQMFSAVQDERGPRKSTIEKRASREGSTAKHRGPKISFRPWRDNTPPLTATASATPLPTNSNMPLSPNPLTGLPHSQPSPFPFVQIPHAPRLNFNSHLGPSQLSNPVMPSQPSANPSGNLLPYPNPTALLQASMFLQAIRPSMRLPSFGYFGQQLPNMPPSYLANCRPGESASLKTQLKKPTKLEFLSQT